MRPVRLIATLFLVARSSAAPPPVPSPAAAAPDAVEQAQNLDAPPHDAPKAWFGVFIEDALDGGIQVIDVVPGGPASRGGLTRGDVLVRANGSDLANIADLRRTTLKLQPGDRVEFTVLRAGAPTNAVVVLSAPPPPGWPVPRMPGVPSRAETPSGGDGIEVAEIPAELRAHLGGSSGSGLLVLRVDPSGPFAKELRAGDLVVKIGDTPLESVARWRDLITEPHASSLRVSAVRDRKTFVAEITLPARSSPRRERDARLRALEAEIRSLDARLAELKRQLAALETTP